MENLPANIKFLVTEENGYFTFKELVNSQVQADCLQCGINIKCTLKSSSNLLLHLERKHPEKLKQYKEDKDKEKTRSERTKKTCAPGPLDKWKIGETSGVAERMLRLTALMIVGAMVPISFFEKKEVIEWITFLNNSINIPNREQLRKKIIDIHSDFKNAITSELAKTDYVCLTADCWTSKNKKRFMGVTAHWLDKKLNRKSAVLALRRFKGEHNYETIATMLSSIMKDFNMDVDKVTTIVTDNGSNFVKAFEKFGVTAEALEEIMCLGDDDEGERADVSAEEIGSILDQGEEEGEDGIKLPKHSRCVPHTLCLVANDAVEKLSDKKAMHSAFGKCSALWTHSSSPKAHETIMDITKLAIIRPAPTRWNSKFDAVCRLLEAGVKEKLDDVCVALCLPKFKQSDLEFLEAYKMVFEPLCSSLDTLQGEDGIFLADLVPELLRIEECLKDEKIVKNKHASKLAESLLKQMKNRYKWLQDFGDESEDFIMATVTHPSFKTRLFPQAFVKKSKDILTKHAVALQEKLDKSGRKGGGTSDEVEVLPPPNKKAKRFAMLDNQKEKQDVGVGGSSQSKAEAEVAAYLNDPGEALESLFSFPLVLKLFRRYNTNIPSSAPVERAFSYAGLVMTPRRNRMKDDLFEALAVLKCTAVFTNE